MAELLTVLSDDERNLVKFLNQRLTRLRRTHTELDNYYRGRQHIQSIGLAVPPELRQFEFPLNWPRVTVDSVVQRQRVKAFSMPDDSIASDALQELWEANNMEGQSTLAHLEARIQGHSFVTVSTNENDPEHPYIRVESSKNMVAQIDPRTRRITAALRIYQNPFYRTRVDYATLYLPDSTIWLKREHSQWIVDDRDDHLLGQVPVVQFLNRAQVGDFLGESEMADVLRPTDMAARAVMDLQVAMETHAVPGKWIAGISDGKFIDPETGEMTSAFKTYYNSMITTENDKARFGQFAASDLTNFTTTIKMLSEQVSAVTGLPMRYFGQNTANPAAEGAIRADEVRLVKNVELKNSLDGDSWSQVMALAYRLATGDTVDGNRVRCAWDDPNTPTYSQKADAIQKMVAAGILSREGAWDELGWSQARKDQERRYFEQQMTDDFLQYLKPEEAAHGVNNDAAGAPTGGNESSPVSAEAE